MDRQRQNKILKANGYLWKKIDQDWLDANDDFETRPGWHLYAPNNRGEISVERALREIEIGVDETEREYQARSRAEFEDQARRAEIKKLKSAVARFIEQHGTRPERQPVGRVVLDTKNIYGGGDWFVICDHEIWYVKNNGMDGDNWSYNNVRTGGAGAIGWTIPMDSQIEYALLCLVDDKTPSRYSIHNGVFVSCVTPMVDV